MQARDYLKLKAAGQVKLEADQRGAVKATVIQLDLVGEAKTEVIVFEVSALHDSRSKIVAKMHQAAAEYESLKSSKAGIEQMITDMEAVTESALPDVLS